MKRYALIESDLSKVFFEDLFSILLKNNTLLFSENEYGKSKPIKYTIEKTKTICYFIINYETMYSDSNITTNTKTLFAIDHFGEIYYYSFSYRELIEVIELLIESYLRKLKIKIFLDINK